jgi:hypothetical protein
LEKGSIDLNNGGGDLIEEVNEYKYLGVYFSRSLKFNYHINSYVKENADQKLNYCIRILGEHGNFNRLSFGDALWPLSDQIRASIV